MNQVVLPTESKSSLLASLKDRGISLVGGVVCNGNIEIIGGDALIDQIRIEETKSGKAELVLVLNGMGSGYLDLISVYLLVQKTSRVISGFLELMEYFGVGEGVLVSPSRENLYGKDGKEFVVSEPAPTNGKKIHTLYVDYRYPVDFYSLLLLVEKVEVEGHLNGESLDRGFYLLLSPEDVINYPMNEDVGSSKEKYVSVIGEVDKPGFYLVGDGVTYGTLLEIAGLNGNPKAKGRKAGSVSILALRDNLWEGRLIEDLNYPINRDVRLVLVLPTAHPLLDTLSVSLRGEVVRVKSLCNNCSQCSDYCPAVLADNPLYPHLILRQVDSGYVADKGVTESALSCLECGVCNVVCPVGIHPLRIVKYVKMQLDTSLSNPTGSAEVEGVSLEWERLSELKRLPREVFWERVGIFEYLEQARFLWY